MTVAPNTAEVVAPADLDGGYHLEIELNGTIRTLIVPAGGVVAGQEFTGLLLPEQEHPNDVQPDMPYTGGVPMPPTTIQSEAQIPTKEWRDGIWDCCLHGSFNPACCMSFWCYPVLLGQTMTRMHLNLCARPGNPPPTSQTSMFLSIIFGAYVLLSIIFYAVMIGTGETCILSSRTYYSDDYYSYNSPVYSYTQKCTLSSATVASLIIMGLLTAAFLGFNLSVMCITRRRIRERYDLPEGFGGDDCVFSTFCPCCTVGQMARHTNDYEAYPVGWCEEGCLTKKGQNSSAPPIIVV